MPDRIRMMCQWTIPTVRSGWAELAYAAVYLASDEVSFLTGQCLMVDGGDEIKLGDLVLD
jgi:NAD(P)-dependent dehydrogenase (short-subunit alcohol dehydrogenase family)